MTSSTDVEKVEGELVTDQSSPPSTLFQTSDPDTALERMAAIARTLVDVLEDRKLYHTINGRKFVTAEGWCTLGGMLGIAPVVEWTRPNESGDGIIARVQAVRVQDGQVVGAAESECSRAESKWRNREPFQIRSMAQTRAVSRALRAPLGQIVVLAGYDPAGAEEITDDEKPLRRDEPEPVSAGKIPDRVKPAQDQVAEIVRLMEELARVRPDVDWSARAREAAGVPGNMLTKTIAAILIAKLEDELEAILAAKLEDAS